MALSPSAIAAAVQAIEQHQRVLVVCHANVDPDAVSSALACGLLLQAIGKEVTILCPDATPESLKFLPGADKLSHEVRENEDFVITINLDPAVEVDKLRYTVEDHRVHITVVPKKGKIRPEQIALAEGEKRYDLIIVIDTADPALLGWVYTEHVDLFSSVPVLNIDHHISNTQFGQVHLIDPTAASATEVLYGFCMQVPSLRDKLTPDIATLLLTGLITDTRSFQNPNTTPRSLEVAAELLERGARQQEIIQQIYKTKPLSTLKIWGRALNRIQVDANARIVWSSISKEDLAEMDAKSPETHGILDELISTIPDADVYVLFTEVEEGGLKASMRSSAAVDVSRLAAQTYGGGGHARASGFKVRSFDNFQLQVLECIRTLKDKLQQWKAEEARAPLQQVLPARLDGRSDGPRPSVSAPIPAATSQEAARVPAKPKTPATGDVVKDLAQSPRAAAGGDVIEELTKKNGTQPKTPRKKDA